MEGAGWLYSATRDHEFPAHLKRVIVQPIGSHNLLFRHRELIGDTLDRILWLDHIQDLSAILEQDLCAGGLNGRCRNRWCTDRQGSRPSFNRPCDLADTEQEGDRHNAHSRYTCSQNEALCYPGISFWKLNSDGEGELRLAPFFFHGGGEHRGHIGHAVCIVPAFHTVLQMKAKDAFLVHFQGLVSIEMDQPAGFFMGNRHRSYSPFKMSSAFRSFSRALCSLE